MGTWWKTIRCWCPKHIMRAKMAELESGTVRVPYINYRRMSSTASSVVCVSELPWLLVLTDKNTGRITTQCRFTGWRTQRSQQQILILTQLYNVYFQTVQLYETGKRVWGAKGVTCMHVRERVCAYQGGGGGRGVSGYSGMRPSPKKPVHLKRAFGIIPQRGGRVPSRSRKERAA